MPLIKRSYAGAFHPKIQQFGLFALLGRILLCCNPTPSGHLHDLTGIQFLHVIDSASVPVIREMRALGRD